MEINTAYFLRLEKKRQLTNVISFLKNRRLHILWRPNLKSVWEFYEKLYKSFNTYNSTVNEYLDDLNLECKLNDKDKTIR